MIFGLVSWARYVSTAAVRRRADLEVRRTIEDVRDAEHARFLNWWSLDDGNRFGLEAELPTSQGAIVARALQRMSDSIPLMPGEDDPAFAPARRADALVALCSNRIAIDADPDRATVVVHAQLGDLVGTEGAAEVEVGGGSTRRPHVAFSVTRGCRRCWRTETANRFDSEGFRGIRRQP